MSWILSVDRSHVCEFQGVKMFTLVGGLCCVESVNLVAVVAGVLRQISSTYWTQLCRFYLKTETNSRFRTAMF
jgi:3-deoxy-D-manno-octulosonic acid (KDO) 8-phosphate synthase